MDGTQTRTWRWILCITPPHYRIRAEGYRRLTVVMYLSGAADILLGSLVVRPTESTGPRESP
jgi:hypothetical protein